MSTQPPAEHAMLCWRCAYEMHMAASRAEMHPMKGGAPLRLEAAPGPDLIEQARVARINRNSVYLNNKIVNVVAQVSISGSLVCLAHLMEELHERQQNPRRGY